MKKISQPWVRAFATVILLILGHGAAAVTCAPPTANSINQVINGTRWELCWGADAQKGMILSQITLTPKSGAPGSTLILAEASLAQLLVAYDNSSSTQSLGSGAVGLPLTSLSASDCPLGVLLQDVGGGGSVCQMILPRGYAWRGGPSGSSAGQIQGESLVIFGVSAAGGNSGNTYIHQWVFDDAGTIQPMLGVSGQLDPPPPGQAYNSLDATTGWQIGAPTATRYATNRFHTAYWRLHFAVAGQGNDLFQQLDHTADATGYSHNQSITNITSEGNFNISPEAQRFWIVKDTVLSNAANGQKISFEIVPQHTSLHRSNPLTGFTGSDVYITQNKDCEQFASGNLIPSPNPLKCGARLPQFANDGDALSDPVAWVGTTWHQVPRAEDEADIKTHWQGFIIAPRDLTATSPL
jgi:primary-amine oxidase